MKNFAERLFCDLKNLDFTIEKPEYIKDGGKVGQLSVTNGIVSEPAKQFVIFGCKIRDSYRFNFGNYEINEENGKTFTAVYVELLEAIKSLGSSHLKFYSLCVPRMGVIEVKLEQFETVITRYVKDYYINTDDLIWRWDVLVSTVKL